MTAITIETHIAARVHGLEMTLIAALSRGTTTIESCATGFRQLKVISGVFNVEAEVVE